MDFDHFLDCDKNQVDIHLLVQQCRLHEGKNIHLRVSKKIFEMNFSRNDDLYEGNLCFEFWGWTINNVSRSNLRKRSLRFHSPKKQQYYNVMEYHLGTFQYFGWKLLVQDCNNKESERESVFHDVIVVFFWKRTSLTGGSYNFLHWSSWNLPFSFFSSSLFCARFRLRLSKQRTRKKITMKFLAFREMPQIGKYKGHVILPSHLKSNFTMTLHITNTKSFEIEQAFHQLSKKYHPDKLKTAKMSEKEKEEAKAKWLEISKGSIWDGRLFVFRFCDFKSLSLFLTHIFTTGSVNNSLRSFGWQRQEKRIWPLRWSRTTTTTTSRISWRKSVRQVFLFICFVCEVNFSTFRLIKEWHLYFV